MKPKVCVLITDGTNCDKETAHAFNLVGGDAEIVHINSLIKGYDPVAKRAVSLDQYQIFVIPGGFSHGDYIASGRILAQYLKKYLGGDIRKFIEDGKLIIGICNGFQVLVKYGLLPMLDGEIKQTTTLTYNESRRFQDRWIKMISPENVCVWTKGIEQMDLPVAHGEGKFVAPQEVIGELFQKKLVVFQYADSYGKPTMEFSANPNGSLEAIAGICDPSGLVFGLMPHPERHSDPNNHDLASLQRILARDYVDNSDPVIEQRIQIIGGIPKEGAGLQIFRNGIEYVIANLL